MSIRPWATAKDIVWAVGIFSIGAALIYPLNFTLFNLMDTPVPYLVVSTYGLLAGLCEILGCRTRSTFAAGAVLPLLVPLVIASYSKPKGRSGEGEFIILATVLAATMTAPIGWIFGFGIARLVSRIRQGRATIRSSA